MSSYIKSEFYRILHDKWTYLFVGICTLLLLSSNVVLAIVKSTDSGFPYATTAFSFANAYSNMFMIFVLCISVSGIVFGNEHNNHTFKNCVSYGITRGTIYFGKLFVQIIYAIVALAIIIGVHVLSAYLLLENSGIEALKLLIRTCLACLPLFIVGLATMNCFSFIIDSSGGAVAAASGIMIVLPLVSNLLGMKFLIFKKLYEVLPMYIMNYSKYDEVNKILRVYWDTESGFRNCWILGMVEMIIITMVGFIIFRKKEIK